MDSAFSNVLLSSADSLKDFRAVCHGFVGSNIQEDASGLAMFGDDHAFSPFPEFMEDLAWLAFHIAYGYKAGKHMVRPPVPKIALLRRPRKGTMAP